MLDYLIETPSPKPSNINMQQLIDELQTATGMDVIYDGPDSIYADSGMLSRVFLNLGRNAAIAGATKLKIDIWRAGRLGVIDILDNGPGVDESARSTIFQAFRTSKSGGTGLGLAIARDLAVSHGGNLKLTRASTEGSEFRLHLPDQIFENADAA
jgi:signal transduction histidine kinase